MTLTPTTAQTFTLHYSDVEDRLREIDPDIGFFPHPSSKMANTLYHVGPMEYASVPDVWEKKRHMRQFLNYLHQEGKIPAGLYFITA